MGSKQSPVEMKKDVKSYWNEEPCETPSATSPAYTMSYFEEIEEYRYSEDPQVFSFAQFTRYRGKRVLEVGVGAGTDLLQWARAGADVHGLDLTEEAVRHTRERLELYGLEGPPLAQADAEALPYPDGSFDLVYSWGVIHHTAAPLKAFDELIRVAKPGGEIKVMVYNRRSYAALWKWLRFGLGNGRPFQSISRILSEHQESTDTQAYTRSEIRDHLESRGIEEYEFRAPLTKADTLESHPLWIRFPAVILARLLGHDKGWYLMIDCRKPPEG